MALQQDTKNKTAVLAFGRMNPPTTGHEKLINKTHEVAKQHGGTAHVHASHSNDKKKNPLPQDKKLGYIRKVAHPDVNVSGSNGPLHAAVKLHDAGHKHLVYVGGSDQHKNIHKVLTKYNGKKGAHGHYNFKSIKSVSAGDRDEKASGTQGMSASKLRDHARAGRHKEFKAGLPKALHPHAKEIHTHVGGTQLESFKEAIIMKKKFKPSGDKTEVITHTMPPGNGGIKGSGGKGAPANTTRTGGIRFGENYMKMVNAEFENFTGENLDEVLSRQARIKKALILRRFKHKIQRRKKMMRKKLATKEMLHRRSRRHAVKLVRKRFMGKKGENYAKLGMADKIMIDKKIATKRVIIDRIAARLLPKVRRAELTRLRDMNKKKATKSAPAKRKPIVIAKPPKPQKPRFERPKATSSYQIPTNVKTEEIINIVDMLSVLSEKDRKALDKKIASSDINSNILFEVFAMGLESEGDQTPQQKGFMSLNTFMAEDYNTPAATEVPDKKYKPEEAINNLALNTRNRNSTIKNYNYGPMNDSDEEYWEKVADLWDTNTKVAKESRCHNCAAFDRKPATLAKMAKVLGPEGDKIVEQAHLGYCEMFAFKCAGQRVCDAWVGGGPITEENKLYEAMANWNDNPITGVQLDRRYNRPMVTRSSMPKLKEFKASGEDSSIEDPIDPKTVTHDIIGKDNEKKKKAKKKEIDKKFEALEWPHGTAKQYKKDTPGQSEETDIEDNDEKVVKKIVKQLKKSVKSHDKQQKKLSKILKKDQQNEEKKNCGCEQDPCITYGKKNEELQTDSEVKKRENERIQGVVKNVRKKQYNLNRRVKRAVNKLPHMQTKVGGVQNEDAEAMARAMQNQRGERDRIRQAYEREMERLDNSEEKKSLKQNHERRLQGLKARQKAARERLRAQP